MCLTQPGSSWFIRLSLVFTRLKLLITQFCWPWGRKMPFLQRAFCILATLEQGICKWATLVFRSRYQGKCLNLVTNRPKVFKLPTLFSYIQSTGRWGVPILPLCLELRSSWPRCLLRVRTRRLLPKLSFLFLTLSNKDSSREAWKNFMKAFVCLKPGIRRHWRRQGFKGSLCCCVPSGPASSMNLEHFIFKDVRNTGDVGWQPEKCCCCCC